jgi:hypothetical protein
LSSKAIAEEETEKMNQENRKAGKAVSQFPVFLLSGFALSLPA